MRIDDSGRVHIVASMPVLRPDEQVLAMMLNGWRNQQLARNLHSPRSVRTPEPDVLVSSHARTYERATQRTAHAQPDEYDQS